MEIKQWEDKNLSHFSYAVLSEQGGKVILIDPSRDPTPYLEYAKQQNAIITGIIETHPHADFVSSHVDIAATTGAEIFVSKLVNAAYRHTFFDDGDAITCGEIKLTAINTPGHSPDSICILLEEKGKAKAVFTGDTLFIGDCGRPDLREGAGNIKATRHQLAAQMYDSLREKLMPLPGDVIVYPAHGAGTLCGKALSDAHSSTMAAEKMTNWSFKEQTKEIFVKTLLEDQPFIPAYFPYDVELNRNGAAAFKEATNKVERLATIAGENAADALDKTIWIVDGRDESAYKRDHLLYSVNLMEKGKFETWLGSIIEPDEEFYLTADSDKQLERLIRRAAAIGYESKIKGAFVFGSGKEKMKQLDVDQFKKHQDDYTIVDVRNTSEVKEGKIFAGSIAIPLAEIRKRVDEVPTEKPIVVHCAGGYRSAAASSIIQSTLNGGATVYDLGDAVNEFAEKN